MTYKTVFLVIALAILAPVFTLISRRFLSLIGKSFYIWVINKLPKHSKLRFKLIENFTPLKDTIKAYEIDFYILLGFVFMYLFIAVYNMFGG